MCLGVVFIWEGIAFLVFVVVVVFFYAFLSISEELRRVKMIKLAIPFKDRKQLISFSTIFS